VTRSRYALKRGVAYASVVGLLVSGAMTGAVLFFQATEHASHVHAGLTGWQAALAVSVDYLGLLTILLLATQVMFGYRLFGTRPTVSRRAHKALAWIVAALLALHGGGLLHSLQGTVEIVPVWLDAIGLGVAVMLALQLSTGYGRVRGLPARALAHSWLGIVIAVVVAAHGFIGVAHTLSG
jgi:hypothetical protein